MSKTSETRSDAMNDSTALRVVMCSKSRWDPAVRREHALAQALVGGGHQVDFIEQPRDVRDLGSSAPTRRTFGDGLRVFPRFTPVPGHHDWLAERVETMTLGATLKRLTRRSEPDVVVVNAPWNWHAASKSVPSRVRKVLDLADDWTTLIPRRRSQIEKMYRQISREADAVIVVNPALADLFDRDVSVVPNAVSAEVLETSPSPAPNARRMVYVGTLSERFDAVLMSEVMRLLPEWTLDLYGPCRYAGLQDGPSAELSQLLRASDGRVSLKGVVARPRVSEALDSARVLVLPNEPLRSEGQDPMKLYDYAARGRPIVATRFRVPDSPPPGMVRASTAVEFAAAVASDAPHVTGNRQWAEANSWAARLPQWVAAVMG